MVLYPISKSPRSELLQGSGLIIFVTLFHCSSLVKKKAPAAAPDIPIRRWSAGATLHRCCNTAAQFPHLFRRIVVE